MKTIFAILAVLFCWTAHAQEVPYGFAPATPIRFKLAVRAAIATRPKTENWIERRKAIGPFEKGPLTFESVAGGDAIGIGNIGAGMTTPATTGDIVRGLYCVAWIYKGEHVSINYNRWARSSPKVMHDDLGKMIQTYIDNSNAKERK